MTILLADVNIQGPIDVIVQRMQAEPWVGFWIYMKLSCVSFADVGLNPTDSDLVIWQRCQQRRIFLMLRQVGQLGSQFADLHSGHARGDGPIRATNAFGSIRFEIPRIQMTRPAAQRKPSVGCSPAAVFS